MLKFTHLDNFRDLGNMKTIDGRHTVSGRLLRSGELSGLTESDITLLRENYDLINIVDLRTVKEMQMLPDIRIAGTNYLALDFYQGEAQEDSSGSREQLEHMKSADEVHKYMEKLYAAFVTQDSVRKALYEFLQMLLRTEEKATLFHCFAGKDRTGIAAAVILTILGVPKSSIMQDYLETNQLRKEANQKMLDSLEKVIPSAAVRKAVLTALCVDERYLEVSYETAQRQFGSFESYISQGIGVSKEEKEKLRRIYLK